MSKTVMIVEDNELNMKLFHDLLEAHGYHPIGTRDGMEALDLARKHRPDLILMDIQLPEVSGLEVTKWLKGDPELKAIPVVAVTAFAMRGNESLHRLFQRHEISRLPAIEGETGRKKAFKRYPIGYFHIDIPRCAPKKANFTCLSRLTAHRSLLSLNSTIRLTDIRQRPS
jgi:two-component system, cell cycle response regulator DivK